MVEWGDKVEFLEELQDGGISPKALEAKPIIHEWMREYTNAFSILHGTRQMGMAPNPIMLSEILAYLKLYGTDDTEAFIDYILHMDAIFMTASEAKRKRAAGNGAGPSP
jgi:hypothetical protein